MSTTYDETKVTREKTAHDGKRPGEFAPKDAPRQGLLDFALLLDPAADYKAHGTDAKAFRAWFGDSKVVDKGGEPQETHNIPGTGSVVEHQGKPIVVYHGTAKGGFEAFDKTKDSGENLYGPGFYFTEDRSVAEEYKDKGDDVDSQWYSDFNNALVDREVNADGGAAGPDLEEVKNAQTEWEKGPQSFARWLANDAPDSFSDMISDSGFDYDKLKAKEAQRETKAVYLNIRNPFDLDTPLDEAAAEKLWLKLLPKEKQGAESFKNYTSGYRFSSRAGTSQLFKAALKITAGEMYDLVNYRSGVSKADLNETLRHAGHDGFTHIGGDRMGGQHHHRVWICFQPNQIKAVDNAGTFDPNNDSIKLSSREEPDYDFAAQHEAVEERVQSASHEADEIVVSANEGGAAIGAEVRREALTALRKLVKQGMQPRELMHAFFAEFRNILRRYEPFLARVSSDAQLASFLKGGKTVIDALLRQARGSPDPFVRYLHELGSDQPPDEPPFTLTYPADPEPRPIIRFPVIDEAARILQSRRVMSPAEFYGASSQAKLQGFTVSRVASLDAVERVQDALTHAVADGDSLRTFTKRVEDSIDRSQLSPARLETIFRVGVMSSYARGMKSVLKHPMVDGFFPFIRRHEIRDSRLTQLCQRLSSGGLPMSKGQKYGPAIVREGHDAGNALVIGGRRYYTGQPVHPSNFAHATPKQRAEVNLPGSQIFWRFDPFFQEHAGTPSHFGCRCSCTPLSIEGAANAGVIVAQEWHRTKNKPPDHMLCVVPFDVTGLEGFSKDWASVWSTSALAA